MKKFLILLTVIFLIFGTVSCSSQKVITPNRVTTSAHDTNYKTVTATATATIETSPPKTAPVTKAPVIESKFYDEFSKCVDSIFLVPGMEEKDFESAMKAITLKNGKSVYQTGKVYSMTGLHSNSYGFGHTTDRAEYFTENKEDKIIRKYTLNFSSDVSGIAFPENIKYGDTFENVLNILDFKDEYEATVKVTDEYKPPNFSLTNSDETKSIGVSFTTSHSEPRDVKLASAYATVYYRENTEKTDDSGKIHKYTRYIGLIFQEGKLNEFNIYMNEEYSADGEPEINNDKVGIKYINPEYKENSNIYNDTVKIRIEEIYHKDQKIYTVYSAKSETEGEFHIRYSGWWSADNGFGDDEIKHTVKKGETRFTDVFEYPSDVPEWAKDLNKASFDFHGIEFILFSSGNIYI